LLLPGVVTTCLLVESVLVAHDLVERVGLEIKVIGELKQRVDLIVAEGVKVKDDSLKMHDKHIRGLR
jgi:hypothetical protein